MNATQKQINDAWFAAIREGRATVYVNTNGVTGHCREHATKAEADAFVAGAHRRIVKRVSPRTVTGEALAKVERFLA